MKYAIIMLLCLAVTPAHAKSEGNPVNPSQKSQYEKQFQTELFAKCNVCHKPYESTLIGSRLIPSYSAISRMDQSTITDGIEHGGHLSSEDKSKIRSVLQSSEPGNVVEKVSNSLSNGNKAVMPATKSSAKKISKKSTKKLSGKSGKKSGKAGKSRKKKHIDSQ